MKNIFLLLLIFQLVSCVSTKNVADSRNRDFAVQNYFERFKFWQELDILRLNNDLLKVKILLIPDGVTAENFDSDSQLVSIYDSLEVIIGEKMVGFREFKTSYFDTTEIGQLKIYKVLKSDSADHQFLDGISDSPYFDLYEDIISRLRKSIQSSQFYSSQEDFENYIRNRSIEAVDNSLYEKIFNADTMSIKKLTDHQIDKLKEHRIDFLISFSGSYNINYSDRAGGRIGS